MHSPYMFTTICCLTFPQFTSLTILIRLVKEESTHLSPRKDEYYFAKTLLKRVVSALLNLSTDDLLLEFVDKYVDVYYDIRYHFLNFARCEITY